MLKINKIKIFILINQKTVYFRPAVITIAAFVYTYILFYSELSWLFEYRRDTGVKKEKKGTWSFSGQRLCLPLLFRHLRIFITLHPSSRFASSTWRSEISRTSYVIPTSLPFTSHPWGFLGWQDTRLLLGKGGEQLILRVICTPRAIS